MPYSGSDPDHGQKVVIFDYWGTKGGKVDSPFNDDFKASIFYVIVGPHQPIMPSPPSKNVHVLYLKWDPDNPFNKLGAIDLKEFLKQLFP